MSPGDFSRAGHYVLGVMNRAEIEAFETELVSDSGLREEVRYWQNRLVPLANLIPPIAPPSDLWVRIEDRIEGLRRSRNSERETVLTDMRNEIDILERARRWSRGLAAALGGLAVAAVAASILLVIERQELRDEIVALSETPPTYVVVLSDENNAPLLLLEALADGGLEATPLRDLPGAEQQTLELWTLIDPEEGPISLGPLRADQDTRIPAARLPVIQPDQLFEVSLEPPGGSPVGRPTGPVLMIGRGFVEPESTTDAPDGS